LTLNLLLEEFSDIKNVIIECSEHLLPTFTIISQRMWLKYSWVAALYLLIHQGCCMGGEEYVNHFSYTRVFQKEFWNFMFLNLIMICCGVEEVTK
jgi:hypothetical protein